MGGAANSTGVSLLTDSAAAAAGGCSSNKGDGAGATSTCTGPSSCIPSTGHTSAAKQAGPEAAALGSAAAGGGGGSGRLRGELLSLAATRLGALMLRCTLLRGCCGWPAAGRALLGEGAAELGRAQMAGSDHLAGGT